MKQNLCLIVLGLLAACNSVEKIYLAETLHFNANYIYPPNFEPQPKRGYWEGNSKKINRQIALYIFNKPPEAAQQAKYLRQGQPALARKISGEHPAIANNRGIACLLTGDYLCAEAELLKAGLNEDNHIRHNYRVLLKLQEGQIVIHKQ